MEPTKKGSYWQANQVDDLGVLPDENYGSEEPLFEPISWEASEYIDHQRDGLWFLGFGVITLLLALFSVFIMHNYFFTVLIVVMAAALFIYTKRPPRILRYTLSDSGLHIGQAFHSYNEYRSFGLIEDGALYAIKLLPVARFGQDIMVYFSEEQGEEIVDIFGSFLPMEQLQLDMADRLLRRLRL